MPELSPRQAARAVSARMSGDGDQASMLVTFLKHHSWRIKAVFGLGPLLIIGCLLWFVRAS